MSARCARLRSIPSRPGRAPCIFAPPTASRLLELGDDFGGGVEFAEAREDFVGGVRVIFGGGVGHRVGGENDVVAEVVRAARGGFDADGGGDAGEHDLCDFV